MQPQYALPIIEVATLNGLDKRSVEHRMMKMTEEQGELIDALLLGEGNDHVIEEAVDTLLMVLSISLEQCPALLEHPDVSWHTIAHACTTEALGGVGLHPLPVILAAMDVVSHTGKVSDALQRRIGVASSAYKPAISDGEFTMLCAEWIVKAVIVLTTVGVEWTTIQPVIDAKMAKWKRVAVEE